MLHDRQLLYGANIPVGQAMLAESYDRVLKTKSYDRVLKVLIVL